MGSSGSDCGREAGTWEMAEGDTAEHCELNSVGRVPSLPQSQPHPVPAFRCLVLLTPSPPCSIPALLR